MVNDAFHITLSVEPSDVPVRGYVQASEDEETDRLAEEAVLARVAGGDVWAWADVTVTATCEGCGARGTDCLGACSYDSEARFREESAYYRDMVDAAKYEAKDRCTCACPDDVSRLAKECPCQRCSPR